MLLLEVTAPELRNRLVHTRMIGNLSDGERISVICFAVLRQNR